MKTLKILAIVASLAMVILMCPMPTFAVNGPLTQQLQYVFYKGQGPLFAGLLAGSIDMMAWPLTQAQYVAAIATTSVTVAPYFDMGDYEIAYNNNATDPSHTADRKAMNYTEFRQAVSCLVNKDGLISGANVNSFGTRIDTQMPRPILNDWVNFGDSKYAANGALLNNYPWDYNVTKALTILYTHGWYSTTTYPNLGSLLTAYATGPGLPAGSVHYPAGHPRAGTTVDSIVAYCRSDHLPRLEAGHSWCVELAAIGCPVTELDKASGDCYSPVFENHDFDMYTAGWSFGIHPLMYYSGCTPIGIYSGGPNLYMISDANMTTHATLEYPSSSSIAMSQSEAKICQDIIVQNAFFVTLYSSASYEAYKTGAVGTINFRGYGLTTQLEYTFMNAKTAPYANPMIIKYGTLNPPVSINPIFSSYVWDYEVVDRIFNGPMNINPYFPTSTTADQPWMAYDWNYQLSNFNGGDLFGNASDSYTQMANVTFWFRHDITWQDGVPWTVSDMEYTMFLNKAYGDSWGYSDAIHIVNFVKINNWTCSFYFDMPTFWALYTTTYDQVPQHIYQYISIPANASDGTSTTGHHGYWPGADAVASEIASSQPANPHPFTFGALTGTGGEQYTWVGTGMWKYVAGTLVQGTGGGLTCVPYSGFWMSIVQGDIDFKYTFNPGTQPRSGSYVIGLTDLVQFALAYGTSGNGHPVPFTLGGLHVWEPGCDIAPPASTVGLSDLVTLALHYGQHWGANP